ncbi:hypothetical protein [Enterococcus sp. CWB-B31]|nr:hypothetical protein [Enterococcus sp. CWB-B31]MCB5955200.1 hypothetical protein [Enterococcus sp. CWB-B31]
MTDESTSLLPITIAPYSYSSSFYAFFLSGESAETIYNKSTYYLETETSHGLFVNKLTTFSFNFEYETRYNKSRLMRIYWHQSKWRKFFNPEFQNKLKLPKLVKIKRNKEQ